MLSAATFGLARYRFRTVLAQRWTGYLTIVVLVGLLGGVAMGSIAAARRTQAAFPVFLASTNPSNLTLVTGGWQPGQPNSAGASLAGAHLVARLPLVSHVADAYGLNAQPLGPDGYPRGCSGGSPSARSQHPQQLRQPRRRVLATGSCHRRRGEAGRSKPLRRDRPLTDRRTAPQPARRRHDADRLLHERADDPARLRHQCHLQGQAVPDDGHESRRPRRLQRPSRGRLARSHRYGQHHLLARSDPPTPRLLCHERHDLPPTGPREPRCPTSRGRDRPYSRGAGLRNGAVRRPARRVRRRARHRARVHRAGGVRWDRRSGNPPHRRPGHRPPAPAARRRAADAARPRCGPDGDRPRRRHRAAPRGNRRLRSRRRGRRGSVALGADRHRAPGLSRSWLCLRLDGARVRVRRVRHHPRRRRRRPRGAPGPASDLLGATANSGCPRWYGLP